MVEESKKYGVTVHRVSQGSGINMMPRAETIDMLRVGRDNQLEVKCVCVSVCVCGCDQEELLDVCVCVGCALPRERYESLVFAPSCPLISSCPHIRFLPFSPARELNG